MITYEIEIQELIFTTKKKNSVQELIQRLLKRFTSSFTHLSPQNYSKYHQLLLLEFNVSHHQQREERRLLHLPPSSTSASNISKGLVEQVSEVVMVVESEGV